MKSPFPGMDPYLERHWQDVHQSICTYARDQMQEKLGGGPLVARLGERLVVETMFDESRSVEHPMKSPFPGMDPYLERHWQDVHQRICTYACDQMQEKLGGGPLVARLGERLVVETMFDESRSIYPDVRVVEYQPRAAELDAGGGGGGIAVAEMTEAATAQAVLIHIDDDPKPEAFIEIIEPDSGRLVTVVEFLSPSNKLSGDGRQQYQKKQHELVNANVSLVEIDLLRGGPRVFLVPEARIPPRHRSEYAAGVFRGWRHDRYELYPIRLRDRLPIISIPLRESDKDIVLDIQKLIEMAYRNGRYERTDYRQPCIPPLEGEDAEWINALLAAGRGKGEPVP
ncbi:MAG TPA: DUF4058 family protein [Tepidisphaeraceae bacterium]|nr:DUF4058 family protein [Tepidisphaeraceae bacterium]